MNIKFPLELLEEGHIELVKLLKATGTFGSGGTAKVAISEGRVLVDGVVELRKGRKIKRGQRVECRGSIIDVV